ncbi:MAG: Asp-tRNA(Asn)/Glu-tRNA(Gln) amidotransferase subunit GatA [Acidobacteriota bacterium]|nr:Asp-tRNA(Asn)/Glu-tRNA(Gln) amidotransferase subunit GatA [Acidobacteriota bacterium]
MTGTTVKDMLTALAGGETSEALVQAHLKQIRERDEAVGAFLTVDEDGALQQARDIDRKRAAGEPLGSLAGIPVAVKDNINVTGLKTTCGSKILADFVSPYDATVIQRLREADAVIVGKTNMDEFAMGSSTEYSALKKTVNPVNPDYVPGGSSGGSTAAVRADMVPLALGSSTGGSIRQPASFCGVVGMKPTYGRVSRYGLTAYGSSLDQIGPIARDVDGAARLLQAVAGHDDRDTTSAYDEAPDLITDLEKDPGPIKVGVIDEFMGDGLDDEVRAAFQTALDRLTAAGAEVVHCSFPHTEYAIPAYYLVATAEASANLARFDGVRYSHRSTEARNLKEMYTHSRSEGFGPEVKRRILLGTYCLSSGYYEGFYLNAQKVRTKIINDFQTAFAEVDVLLSPTCPTTAFKFGEKTDDPVSMYLSDIYTVMANLAGVPALSLPVGADSKGLPIGAQLITPRFTEARLFQLACHTEKLVGE